MRIPGPAGAGLALLLTAACGGPVPHGGPTASPPGGAPGMTVERTDAVGRVVNLPARPERIVSLAPSITETLFLVGAGDRVVGVTDQCDHPPEAASRARVGGMTEPSLEAIVALAPDLVLVTTEGNRPATWRRMVDLGLPVYSVDREEDEGLEGVFRAALRAGEAAGEPGNARRVVAEAEARLSALKARASPGGERTPVLALVSVEPAVAAGPGTFLDALLRAAGYENAAPTGEDWPRVSPEGLRAMAPRKILIFDPEKTAGEEGIRRLLSPWSARLEVWRIDHPAALRPSIRSLEALARILETRRSSGPGGGR